MSTDHRKINCFESFNPVCNGGNSHNYVDLFLENLEENEILWKTMLRYDTS